MGNRFFRRTDEEVKQAFLSRVDSSGGSFSCHPFQGTVDRHGYGQVKVDGKLVGSHRFAYLTDKGLKPCDLPNEKLILHSCDNPICCNPNHLRVGSTQENVNDRVKRKGK